MIAHTPWIHKRGSTERGLVWGKIANSLNTFKNPTFRVTQRSVRDRYALLEKKHKLKLQLEEQASVISPDETEVDRALDDITIQFKEADAENDRISSEKKAKQEAEVGKAEEMRKASLETFKETQKRNESCEETTPRKKKRASGSEIMSFLREKTEMELELRAQEMEMRRQEFEKQQELKEEEIKLRQQEQKEKQDGQLRMNEQMLEVQRMQQQQVQQLMQQQQQQSAMMLNLLQKAFEK